MFIIIIIRVKFEVWNIRVRTSKASLRQSAVGNSVSALWSVHGGHSSLKDL